MHRWLVLCTLLSVLGCNPKDPKGSSPLPSGSLSPASAVGSAMLLPDSDPIPGPDDHGDDPAQATAIAAGQTLLGVLSDGDDRDAFALDLTGGARVVLQAHALGAVRLELLRPDGSRLQREGNHLQLDLDAAVAGRYTLVVRSLVGAQDYALTVERTR
ncbi:MAG: hypothetical protein KDD82_23445 [Planctomycetes bacterium]|nr:hypothetical protein [Planctomycetota bacterium]